MPPELQRIVSKCLRKERDERYQTMKDVLLIEGVARRAGVGGEARTLDQTCDSAIENQQTLIADGGITKEASRQATSAASAPTTSSAEYLVSEIRRHKRSVIVTAIVAATSGCCSYFLSLDTEKLDIDRIDRGDAVCQ